MSDGYWVYTGSYQDSDAPHFVTSKSPNEVTTWQLPHPECPLGFTFLGTPEEFLENFQPL